MAVRLGRFPNYQSASIRSNGPTDGTLLYGYRRGELPSKIYKVEIATGKQTVLQQLRPGEPAGVVMVAPVVVSRDGTRFVYSYNQVLSVLFVVSGLH